MKREDLIQIVIDAINEVRSSKDLTASDKLAAIIEAVKVLKKI